MVIPFQGEPKKHAHLPNTLALVTFALPNSGENLITDSRRKGKHVENELAQALRAVFPDARRNLDQTRESTGRDFDGTAPLCVQLKAGKAPSWRKALEEAQGSAQLGEAAVGVTRQDREGFVVHLSLEDFLALIDRGHAQADHEFDDRQERLLAAMADHGRSRR